MDDREFVPHGARSISEMVKHRKELDAYLAEVGTLELPDDLTYDIPPEGRVWLAKAGVPRYLADAYEIQYSPSMARVVIPVWDKFNSYKLLAVQCRAVFDGDKPKYLNKSGGDTTAVLLWSKPDYRLKEPPRNRVVLTEDAMSMIRVGRMYEAVSSLGTYLSPKHVSKILDEYGVVYIWYDGDEAGINGAAKAKKALEMQGAEVHVITTDKDPKMYSNDEIMRIIDNA